MLPFAIYITIFSFLILAPSDASYEQSDFQKKIHKILAEHGLTEVIVRKSFLRKRFKFEKIYAILDEFSEN